MTLPRLPHVIAAVALLIAVAVCEGLAQDLGKRPDFSSKDAIEGVLDAFERYPLVGIGELHGNEQVHDLVLSLVRHPRFAERVQDIVVEFGNARYQDMVDSYIAGEEVPIERLREVWRNTVNPLTWDSPIYERFYRVVREVNATLSEDRHLRVLLGDVPVDWTRVQKMDDFGELGSRDGHFAEVVEKEVLTRGRRALLVSGQWHLYKRNPSVEDPSKTPLTQLNTAEILLRAHPGKLWTIQPMDLGRGEAELEPHFAGWRIPVLAPVMGTWLGATNFGKVTPFPDKIRFVDGKEVDMPKDAPFPWPNVEEVMDAYVFLGPKRSLRWQPPDKAIYTEPAYIEELRRRGRLMGYPAKHFKAMTGQDL